jgi:hypothetical protein
VPFIAILKKMVRLGQKIATLVFDGGAIRFKHDFGTSGSELLSEALHYFCCRDIFERVALGRRPMSENASKVLQQKSGGQETLPRRLSDNKILFEWCCPPVFHSLTIFYKGKTLGGSVPASH